MLRCSKRTFYLCTALFDRVLRVSYTTIETVQQKWAMTKNHDTSLIHAALALPRNETGRDFVVGDLHGCADHLFDLLGAQRFDIDHDRLFCVGDLIDRGPDSLWALSLLKEPWFYATLGNHEAMLLTYLRRYESRSHLATDFIANGGYWIHDLGPDDRAFLASLIPSVEAMPLVITVDADIPFNVTHGDLLRFDCRQDRLTPDRLITRHDADASIWSRRLISGARNQQQVREIAGRQLIASDKPWLPDLNLSYVGHTTARNLILHKSHLLIDRGGYRRINDGDREFELCVIEHASFAEELLANTPR